MLCCLTLIMANVSNQGYFVTYHYTAGLCNFSTSDILGWITCWWEGCMQDSQQHLWLLLTRCQCGSAPPVVTQKCLQTLPNVSWEENHPQLKTTAVLSTNVITVGWLLGSLAKLLVPVTFSSSFCSIALDRRNKISSSFLFLYVSCALNLYYFIQYSNHQPHTAM